MNSSETMRNTVVGLNSIEGKEKGNQVYRLARGRGGMLPILEKSGLKLEDEVLVPSLVEKGSFTFMTIKKEWEEFLVAENNTCRSYLKHNGTWTCEKTVLKPID